MKNYHYRIHLNGGDLFCSTLAEAKRQARNLARASKHDVWVTREPVCLVQKMDENNRK